MSTFPTDVNDSGVIVGVSFSPQWNPIAVRWTPAEREWILCRRTAPTSWADSSSSYALGINNLGQIVGARRALGYAPTGQGWLYSEQQGLVDIAARYNWWSYPTKLNDVGQVIGGAELLDLNTGTVRWIGDGPSNYNAVGAVDINNNGMMAGSASLRSTSLNIVSVFRYEGAAGWRFIAGSSKYAPPRPASITRAISVTASWAPACIWTGWASTPWGVFSIRPYPAQAGPSPAAAPRSTTSGLSPRSPATRRPVSQAASCSHPQAPCRRPPRPPISSVWPTPARGTEPYNSINLTWENTSSLTRGYELQRRAVGTNNWTSLALTPPGTATSHTDTTVGVGITYEYRVAAVGLGGNSPWSNIATVTAPATPLDTTPPSVSILSPANGASVSGHHPVCR